MRRSLALETAALLAAIGALAGFATAQFLPRRFVSRTTVAFTGSVSSERCAQAVERTLSSAELTPIVLQSAYYRSELDYTPVEELVQRIQDNGSIRSVRIGNRDGFRVEFTDADRYAALDMTRTLAQEMGQNAGDTTQVVDPIRAGLKPPGPGLCVLLGLGCGLLLGMLVGGIARRSNPKAPNRRITS
jgi:hypothetical protein